MEQIRLLRIGSLNCQGIVEKIDYPQFQNLLFGQDIFGVSETWLNENTEKNIYIPGFKFYPLNRTKGKREKGTSRGGIGVFIKKEIKEHIKIRYDISSENFLWCKLSKRYFGSQDDIYIAIVYIPPEKSTREVRLNIDHYKHLQETTAKLNNSNIILIGDFNARTKTLDDTLASEKHDNSMPENFYSKIKSERSNQDIIGNGYGNKLTDYCIATQSYILNGRT